MSETESVWWSSMGNFGHARWKDVTRRKEMFRWAKGFRSKSGNRKKDLVSRVNSKTCRPREDEVRLETTWIACS